MANIIISKFIYIICTLFSPHLQLTWEYQLDALFFLKLVANLCDEPKNYSV